MNNLQVFESNKHALSLRGLDEQQTSPSVQRRADAEQPARKPGQTENAPLPELELLGARGLRGLELIMAELQVADLIIGELRGAVELEELRQAAARVQARHPGLRALVQRKPAGRPAIQYYAADASRVHVAIVREDDELSANVARPRWQQVAEREAAHRFDLTKDFGFRVLWVPNLTGGHLIVNAPHAVVDGVSLMRLLHEVLAELAIVRSSTRGGHLPEVVALVPTPAVLDQVPLTRLESVIGRVAKHVTLYQQRSYARRALLPIAGQLAPGQAPRASAVFRIGEKLAYARVVAACKRKKVTVGCLFSAAVELAVLRYLYEETGRLPAKWNGDVKLPISMDFSLRRLIDGASRTQPSIGLFTGVGDVGVAVSREITLWQLAERIVGSSRGQLQQRVPLLFHKALDSMTDLAAALRSYGVSYRESGGVADGVNVSSVGTYPYPTEHGALRLEQVFGLNGALNGGPMLIFWLRSVDDHFCYNATGASPACTRETVERITSYVVEIMENADNAVFDQLTLQEYVSEGTLR